jgi:NAD(P)H-dependent FMN reductase
MTEPPRILAFAGSTRVASYNKRLVRIAAAGAEAAGARATVIDLRDFPLPLYDADQHAADGLPETARALKALFAEHQGLLISSPEYNGGMSGVLKNAIDWVSRGERRGASMEGFSNKAAAIMAAGTGTLGGLRGLVHLRQILTNVGVLVLPQQRAVPRAAEAFDEQGGLRDPEQQAAIAGLGARLAELLRKLAS